MCRRREFYPTDSDDARAMALSLKIHSFALAKSEQFGRDYRTALERTLRMLKEKRRLKAGGPAAGFYPSTVGVCQNQRMPVQQHQQSMPSRVSPQQQHYQQLPSGAHVQRRSPQEQLLSGVQLPQPVSQQTHSGPNLHQHQQQPQRLSPNAIYAHQRHLRPQSGAYAQPPQQGLQVSPAPPQYYAQQYQPHACQQPNANLIPHHPNAIPTPMHSHMVYSPAVASPNALINPRLQNPIAPPHLITPPNYYFNLAVKAWEHGARPGMKPADIARALGVDEIIFTDPNVCSGIENGLRNLEGVVRTSVSPTGSQLCPPAVTKDVTTKQPAKRGAPKKKPAKEKVVKEKVVKKKEPVKKAQGKRKTAILTPADLVSPVTAKPNTPSFTSLTTKYPSQPPTAPLLTPLSSRSTTTTEFPHTLLTTDLPPSPYDDAIEQLSALSSPGSSGAHLFGEGHAHPLSEAESAMIREILGQSATTTTIKTAEGYEDPALLALGVGSVAQGVAEVVDNAAGEEGMFALNECFHDFFEKGELAEANAMLCGTGV
ncbi:hypothetical protein HK101_005443 [Irineochytrium annulatum]|nr:hypothetical protein HK101_005443 [Irineochytrium annulatum]